jgi:hypothetical protein
MFNNSGRFDADPIDNTRKNMDNIRYSHYVLGGYGSVFTADHVKFATQQPALIPNGTAHGSGINGQLVDSESILTIKSQSERPLEKLQLMQRPFITVPYLGRGMADIDIESRLIHGENTIEMKSVSSNSEQMTADYAYYPTDEHMKKFVSNPKYTVEEAALDGWVRGGANTHA